MVMLRINIYFHTFRYFFIYIFFHLFLSQRELVKHTEIGFLAFNSGPAERIFKLGVGVGANANALA